jgi:hypothetical protein
MSVTVTYTDLEMDNVFATSKTTWKQEGIRKGPIRTYRMLLLNAAGEVIHTIEDQPTIEAGKQACALWCVVNRGGRHREMADHEKQDVRIADLEARLAENEMQLNALRKAAEPPEGEPKPGEDDEQPKRGRRKKVAETPAEVVE